ncbi:MAG: hypothetical protein IKJ07_10555, partial [Clostridia bacterium]|nr:hypothetical protein [Clostridia bacterium]
NGTPSGTPNGTRNGTRKCPPARRFRAVSDTPNGTHRDTRNGTGRGTHLYKLKIKIIFSGAPLQRADVHAHTRRARYARATRSLRARHFQQHRPCRRSVVKSS